MKYPAPKTKEGYEIISLAEFKKRKNIEVSTNTLSYQFKNETLDYCQIGTSRFIIWNGKAKNFELTSRGRKKILQDRIHKNVDPAMVKPTLKTFSKITVSDLNKLIDSIVFNTQPLFSSKFRRLPDTRKSYIRLVTQHNGEDYLFVTIRPNWAIEINIKDDPYSPHPPDNYPELVFLLCKLGYDVIPVGGNKWRFSNE